MIFYFMHQILHWLFLAEEILIKCNLDSRALFLSHRGTAYGASRKMRGEKATLKGPVTGNGGRERARPSNFRKREKN